MMKIQRPANLVCKSGLQQLTITADSPTLDSPARIALLDGSIVFLSASCNALYTGALYTDALYTRALYLRTHSNDVSIFTADTTRRYRPETALVSLRSPGPRIRHRYLRTQRIFPGLFPGLDCPLESLNVDGCCDTLCCRRTPVVSQTFDIPTAAPPFS
jgi:hypothetical protein